MKYSTRLILSVSIILNILLLFSVFSLSESRDIRNETAVLIRQLEFYLKERGGVINVASWKEFSERNKFISTELYLNSEGEPILIGRGERVLLKFNKSQNGYECKNVYHVTKFSAGCSSQ